MGVAFSVKVDPNTWTLIFPTAANFATANGFVTSAQRQPTWANDAARTAATPAFIGQVGLQLDTAGLWSASSTSAGGFNENTFAANSFQAAQSLHVGTASVTEGQIFIRQNTSAFTATLKQGTIFTGNRTFTLPNFDGLLATTAIAGGGTNATTAVGIHNNSHTEGASIVSAGTVNLDAATGYFVHITAANTIAAFTLAQGNMRVLVFDSTPELTHSASLILCNGGNDIVAEAGDCAIVVGEGSGVTRMVSYQRATGAPLSLSGASITASQISDATSAAVGLITNLPVGDSAGSYVLVDDSGGASIITNNFSDTGLTSVDVDKGLVTTGT